jgi:hypothetical protein
MSRTTDQVAGDLSKVAVTGPAFALDAGAGGAPVASPAGGPVLHQYVQWRGLTIHLRWTVDPATGCHIWAGALSHGYGAVGTNRHGVFRAHRVAYEVTNGPIPDGLQFDHRCRNRACISPAHLEPVTNAENTRRGAKAKLTWAKVDEIRRLYAQGGISQRELGRRYGVSGPAITNLLNGKRWGDAR